MKFFYLIILLPGLTGCAWRTSHADHVLGPTFYRFNKFSPEGSLTVQTLHVPLLLEGGRQWGVSIGGVQRLAMVPGETQRTAANSDEQPRGCFISSQPNEWHFSWFYVRAPLRKPPVFVRRSLVGAHGGVGVEERTFSLGYSSTTATTPHEEAIYRLEFDSRHPLDATFVMNPAADPEPTKQNPSLKKE